jgi:hypothetical protein
VPLQQAFIQVKDETYPHYYLCNYLPVSAGKDTLSHSLLLFKRAHQPDLSGWIDCSLEIFASACLPIGTHPIPILPGSTIVRALHHNETVAGEAGPAALDQLGKALASRFQCRYAPSMLHKSRLTREIKGFTRQQRETELQGLYYICMPPPTELSPSTVPPDPAGDHPDQIPQDSPILIIDDILTTATTVKMIIAAVRGHFPRSPLAVFTLAKADYDAGPNKTTLLKGQNYVLEQGTDWLVAEETATYYSSQQLKTWINSGSF